MLGVHECDAKQFEGDTSRYYESRSGVNWRKVIRINRIPSLRSGLTDNAGDEGIPSGLDAHHLRVLLPALSPPADCNGHMEIRVLFFQGDEFLETTVLHVVLRKTRNLICGPHAGAAIRWRAYLLVQDKDAPRDITHSDEGVYQVSTFLSRYVVYAVAAFVRSVYRPVAEITGDPRSTWRNRSVGQRELIRSTGCIDTHRPQLQTRRRPAWESHRLTLISFLSSYKKLQMSKETFILLLRTEVRSGLTSGW